ncbi:MAG: glycosyltransferase [Candidatus Hydrogenedentota bacterium]
MNILVLTHTFPRYDGDMAGIFVEELSIAYKKLGHNVTVFAPYIYDFKRNNDEIPVKFVMYKYLPFKKWHILGYSRVMMLDQKLKIVNFILAPFLIFFGIVNLLVLVKKLRPDFIHAQWGIPFGFIGAVVSLITGIPLAISFLGSDVQLFRVYAIFKLTAKFICNQAKLLTANSRELIDAMAALGASPAKFRTIIYSCDPDKFKPNNDLRVRERTKLNIPETSTVLLFIGRFVPKKGLEYLIRALPYIINERDDFVLVIIGGGDLENRIKGIVKELNLEKYVIFLGIVPTKDLILYYNMSDIFITPAVKEPIDGLNVVVVEAMSCGKPVVATNVSGNPLIVKDGENGLLVDEKDPMALSKAILKMLNNPELRKKMGESGRDYVVKLLNWTKIADEVISGLNHQ